MSITSLYSTSSSGSSRQSSIERPPLGLRKFSIELLPNQSIFRETFIGASVPRLSSPPRTPTDEMSPTNSSSIPLNHACTACSALANSMPIRKGGAEASFKRHAVILPTRHQGPHCKMPPPPTGALPALPSISEDCLVEWERKGSMAVAHNTPSPISSMHSTPLTSPTPLLTSSPRAAGGDYFASVTAVAPSPRLANLPRFVASTFASPRLGGSGSPRMGSGRPSTPVTPTRDYRSFLRML